MSTFLCRLSLISGGLVSLMVLACGGDDLVLPSEGTAASIAIAGGNNQTGTVGAALADSLKVRVLDKAGRPVPNQPVAWTVVAGGGSVAPATSNTDGSGFAGASWTLGSGAGTQQVRAKPAGNGAPDDLQAIFAATAGASSASSLLKVAGDSQTAVAGSVLDDSLVVRVTDASGNPVAGVPVSWSLTGGGALSATSLPTGADGRSAVSRTLGPAAGKQTTTAAAAGLTGSPIGFTSTATVGSAGRLVIAQQPSGAAASGAAFGRQPTVQMQDANGNNVNLTGIAVEAALASNPGGGSLIGNTTATTNGGLATFGSLGISGPAGSYTINFSVPNRNDISGTPPSSPIVISAGAASRLTFATQPASTTTGIAIAPAVTVRVEDAQGTLVTSATNNVTMGLSSNPGGATLSGTKTVAASGGIATFANLLLNRPGTGYTLSASASGLSSDISSAFSVSTGAATAIAANSDVTISGTAGSAVSPKPSVKVTDGSGNGIGGVNVTFAVTQGGGSVSGATQTTDAGGIATVGSWTLGTTAGSNQLTASAAGLTGSPVTFTATASAGAAGQLLIAAQPASSGTSGVALSPQPVIQLADVNGNPVTTGGIQVTATIASGPTGTLTNSTRLTSAGTGKASFSGLAISGPSGTYTLAFSGPGLTGVTSNSIVIGAGAATRLGIATPPPSTVVNGAMFAPQPIIQLEDAAGNPVGAAGVTVSASLVPSSGATLSGDLTRQTNSSGQASFADLVITGAAGNRTILFAAGGLTSVPSGAITVTPGPVDAAKSALAVSSSSIIAGDAGTTVTVAARDQSDNVVPGVLIQPAATNGGTFTPSSATSDGTGQGSFNFTSTVAGAHQISATVDGVLLSTTRTVTVQPGAVNSSQSSLGITPSSVPAGSGSSTATVTARDQFGNLIPGQAVTLSVTGTGNSISANPVSTNVSGVATFTVSSTDEGAKTVTASIDGTVLDDAPTLTVTSGGADAGNSQVSVTPGSTSAGAGVTVAVTFADQFGNPVDGQSVSLSSDKAGAFGQPTLTTDAGGQASTSFTPQGAGSHTITASLGGLDESTSLSVSPAAPADATSSVSVNPAAVASGEATVVSMTFQDQFGNPVAGGSVSMTVSGGSGVFTTTPVVLDGNGQGSTSYTPSDAGSHIISATLGALEEQAILTVNAAPVSGANSSLDAGSPSELIAGQSRQVTVTARNTLNQPIAGVTVSLQMTPPTGNGTINDQVTDGSGVATFTVSSTKAQGKLIAASINGTAVAQTGALTIVPAAADAGTSTLILTPAAVTDGGTVDVTAVFHDAFNNAVADSTAVFTTDQSGSFLPASVTTDASGSASSSYTATGAGSHNLTVTAAGLPLSQLLTVTSVAPPSPDAAQSSVTADSPVQPSVSSTVTIVVHDALGNPIQGVTVTLAETGARGTVIQPASTTDLSGQATGSFSALLPDTYTIQATADGVTINQTAAIIVQL